MLASKLFDVANDIKLEADRNNLITLLQQARNLSATRGSMSENNYRSEAQKLRSAARDILEHNIFNDYPKDVFLKLRSSDISALLPDRIANLILSAIPAVNMSQAAASSEFDIYINEASNIYNQVSGFLVFSDSIGIERYELQSSTSSLELELPRSGFDNELTPLAGKLVLFDRFFKSMGELSTGTRSAPSIVYISTTDPAFFMEWLPIAVGAVLAVYTPLLDAAERTVNVLKTIKDLLGVGADESQASAIRDKLKDRNEETTKQKIHQHLDNVVSPVEEPRLTELKAEITIHAVLIVHEIAQGARISRGTGDHGQNIPPIVGVDGTEVSTPKQVEYQRLMETRLNTLFESMEDKQALLQDLRSTEKK
ncbi:hypothetical protein ACFZ8E_06330 [Methylobacterium sp. HMF5984]|uniref:hypothetical protein n=1 Tax=Methylobacterium sp. HMF5984 TaxID=3367370 RepID=UPI0038545E85